MMTTLPSESLSTESLSTEPLLSTSSSDTKQTCDETTVQVESEMMRKIVYNLLKLDSDVQNMSVRAKQIYYRNNLDAV